MKEFFSFWQIREMATNCFFHYCSWYSKEQLSQMTCSTLRSLGTDKSVSGSFQSTYLVQKLFWVQGRTLWDFLLHFDVNKLVIYFMHLKCKWKTNKWITRMNISILWTTTMPCGATKLLLFSFILEIDLKLKTSNIIIPFTKITSTKWKSMRCGNIKSIG